MLTIRHEIFHFPFQLWDEKLNQFERVAVDFRRVSIVIDFCHHRVRFGKIWVGRDDAACFAVFHFTVVWMMLQILRDMKRRTTLWTMRKCFVNNKLKQVKIRTPKLADFFGEFMLIDGIEAATEFFTKFVGALLGTSSFFDFITSLSSDSSVQGPEIRGFGDFLKYCSSFLNVLIWSVFSLIWRSIFLSRTEIEAICSPFWKWKRFFLKKTNEKKENSKKFKKKDCWKFFRSQKYSDLKLFEKKIEM